MAFPIKFMSTAFLAGITAIAIISKSVQAYDLPVVGLIEDVHLDGLKIDFRAKIDTGAKSSAVNAQDIEVFKKDGKDWVRFTLVNKGGERVKLMRPVYRFARIRRSGTKVDRRPVVKLSMCLGHFHANAQFTLKDRRGMNYAMLIARRVLDNNFLVNSAKTHLTKPNCKN